MLSGCKKDQALLPLLYLFTLLFVLTLGMLRPAFAQNNTVSTKQEAEHESPCFPISHISLVGDSAKHFQFALKPVISGDDSAIGRCLGAKGINKVLARVQNAILKKGYSTTRVLAAPQNLKCKKLNLTVIPGRAQKISFADEVDRWHAAKWNALPIQPGDILNLRDIEQGLENFKRIPTVEADIQIEPAHDSNAKPGDSEVVIRYKQAFPLRLTLSVDDSGPNQTGKYQGAAIISYDNPFKLNDIFYLSLNHDLGGGTSDQYGTKGYTLYYSVPFRYWQFSVNTSQYHYEETVAGASQSYIYSGESQNTEIALSKMVYRDAITKSSLALGAYLQNSRNFIEDTEIEVQHRRRGGWRPSISYQKFMGMATLDINLAYRFGTRTFGSLPAPEEGFGEGTSFPNILTSHLALNIPFNIRQQHFRYNTLWRAQWSFDTLIPQDRFAIGGRYSVRGFDGVNILSAENGWLTRNDLGLILGKTQQEFYVGADYGQVYGPSSDLLLGKQLAGAVTGLRGGYKGFNYDLFLGWPIDKPVGFQTASTTGGFSVSWSS